MDLTVEFAPPVATYRIDDQQPGRRLELVWQGPGPLLAVRWLALAVVVAVLGGAAWFAVAQLVPIAQNLQAPAARVDLPLFVLGGFLVVGAVAGAFGLVRGVGTVCQYVSHAVWDAGAGTFELTVSGWMLFGSRRVRGKLAAISACEMAVGAEVTGPLPVRIKLDFPEGKRPGGAVLKLPIVSVDNRAQAIALLFELARIIGYARCLVVHNDLRQLTLKLLRAGHSATHDDDDKLDDEADEDDEGDDGEGDEPETEQLGEPTAADGLGQVYDVPTAGAEQPIPLVRREFVEPTDPVPELDLDVLCAEEAEARIVEWDPPRRMRFARDAVARSVVVVSAVMAAIAGAIVGAWPFHEFVESAAAVPPSRWETGVLGAVVAAFVAGFLVWALNRQREVTIDLPAGTITCQQGDIARQYVVGQVCEVVLAGEKDQKPEGTPGERMQYRCRIELGVAQSDEWVFDSAAWQPKKAGPYRQLLPVAVELARALDVPFRWQDYGQPGKLAWHRRTGWKERIVLAAVALSVVGYVSNQAARTNKSRAAVEGVRATGADVTMMNGYSIQDHLVLANYWQVKLTSEQYTEDRLRAVVEAIKDLDRVGLVLEDTKVDDAGLATIGQARQLLLLDLANTNVTSQGLAQLAGFDDLVYLSVAVTIAGDDWLEGLPPLASLQFLNLATTNVGDRGLDQLVKFPKLKWVALHNLHVSEAAVARLRAARPGLIVVRQ